MNKITSAVVENFILDEENAKLAKYDSKADKLNPILSNALKLLPLVESYFICHAPSVDYLKKSTRKNGDSGIAAMPSSMNSPTNSYNSFWHFCYLHRRLLNMMIRSQPDLLIGRPNIGSNSSIIPSFIRGVMECLVYHPKKILDFENKKSYFKSELNRMNTNRRDSNIYI